MSTNLRRSREPESGSHGDSGQSGKRCRLRPPNSPADSGSQAALEDLEPPDREPRVSPFQATNRAKNTLLPKNTYVYETIRPDQIRLLRLHCGEGDESIMCSLASVDLIECPKFEALSYTWGVESPTHQIDVLSPVQRQLFEYPDNHRGIGDTVSQIAALNRVERRLFEYRKIYVKPNLRAALRSLRRKDRDLLLWIDAICINQRDLDEKSHQISLMPRIYERAHRVVIWLGEGSFTSSFSTDCAKSLLQPGFLAAVKENGVGVQSFIPGFLDIIKHPWFSRLWAFQEISLARRATILLGTSELDWDDFKAASVLCTVNSHVITHSFAGIEDYGIQQQYAQAAKIAAHLVSAQDKAVSKSASGQVLTRSQKLESLVLTTTTLSVTNRKDKIYALLGLASDVHDEHSELHPLIRPNYNRTLRDVYVDFVKFSIGKSGSLDILLRPWAPLKRSAIHSWPKWRTPPLDGLLQRGIPSWIATLDGLPYGYPSSNSPNRLNANCLVGEGLASYYHVTKGIRPQFRFGHLNHALGDEPRSPNVPNANSSSSMSDGSLSVMGVKIGSIGELSSRIINGVVPRDALALMGCSPARMKKLPDRVWQMLIAGRDNEHATADADSDGDDDIFYDNVSYSHTFPWGVLERIKKQQIIDIQQIFDEHPSHYIYQRVLETIWNRRVFLDKSPSKDRLGPSIMGLAPQQAEVGDCVCLLFGCSVPVILRKHCKRNEEVWYELVGEAYVRNQMDGECLQDIDPDELDSWKEEFLLY